MGACPAGVTATLATLIVAVTPALVALLLAVAAYLKATQRPPPKL